MPLDAPVTTIYIYNIKIVTHSKMSL
jgi:hypothetical protein